MFISTARSKVAAAVLLALSTVPALADDEETKPTPPPGLPAGADWTFNLDATFGTFGFGNSLYRNPRPDPSGDLGDNWNEGTIKAGLSGVHATDTGEWYGKLSGVGEGTFSSSPTLVGGDSTSFGVEDLYIGWRSGGRQVWSGSDQPHRRSRFLVGLGRDCYEPCLFLRRHESFDQE